MTTRKLAVAAAILLWAIPAAGQQSATTSAKQVPKPSAQAKPKPAEAVPADLQPYAVVPDEPECAPGKPYVDGCYEKIVASMTTTKDKVEYLARVVDSLQGRINTMDQLIGDEIKVMEQIIRKKADADAVIEDERVANDNTKLYNAALADLDSRLQRLQFNSMSNSTFDSTKRDLRDFEEAVCPILKQLTRDRDRRLSYACN